MLLGKFKHSIKTPSPSIKLLIIQVIEKNIEKVFMNDVLKFYLNGICYYFFESLEIFDTFKNISMKYY